VGDAAIGDGRLIWLLAQHEHEDNDVGDAAIGDGD
jgi:hypothetical protein